MDGAGVWLAAAFAAARLSYVEQTPPANTRLTCSRSRSGHRLGPISFRAPHPISPRTVRTASARAVDPCGRPSLPGGVREPQVIRSASRSHNCVPPRAVPVRSDLRGNP
jgi:hypothetical protein